MEVADARPPESLFERRWAITLLDESLVRLGNEYQSTGKVELFAALEPPLQGAALAIPFAEVGGRLGLSEGALSDQRRNTRHPL